MKYEIKISGKPNYVTDSDLYLNYKDFIKEIRNCNNSDEVENLFMKNGFRTYSSRIPFMLCVLGAQVTFMTLGKYTDKDVYDNLLCMFDTGQWQQHLKMEKALTDEYKKEHGIEPDPFI